MKKGIFLISHGSHSRQAKIEVQELVHRLKKLTHVPIFEYAFLEINTPNIPSGIKRCVRKGAEEIMILFNFLNSGEHVLKDIPRIIKKTTPQFPHLRFYVTPPIGQHPLMTELFVDFLNKSKRRL